MHDEVYEATQDSAGYPRDSNINAASSPSEAYANMTLESRETNGVMAIESENTTRTADSHTPRPPPRSSSPAKRPHSDMDDTTREHMDVEAPAGSARRGSGGQSSPRTTKPLPVASSAPRSLRATSVDMLDAPVHASAGSSDSLSTSNAASTATSVSRQSPPANIPSLDDQVHKVMAISYRPLVDGQLGYVISERWLERVFARTSENAAKPEQFNKAASEGEIGPVDNTDLIDSDQKEGDFVPLRAGLQMGQDFEILPAEAWELIVSWYGQKDSSPTIQRYVHNTAVSEYQENLQYEVYPPIFTIRKVRRSASTSQPSQDSSERSPRLVASRSDSYVGFLKTAKKAAGIDMKTKVRVWRVLNTAPTDQAAPQPSGMLTPDSSPRNGSPMSVPQSQPIPLAIDITEFTALAYGTERELLTGKDETANEKYNGHMNLQIAGLAEDQVLILEEQNDRGDYLTEAPSKATSKEGVPLGNKAATKAIRGTQSKPSSGRNSPAPGPLTRGRTRGGRTRGTVGLTNLGNTCYMNSALQCIRSVEELTWYFFQNNYKAEINSDNPLGHNGTIAKSYASLVASIYAEDGASSFAPRQFKMALGKAQPLFSGYGQQDSQEFLSFLVDGLHEDLNRIKKKPYTEYPESDDNTINDPEAIKALGDKFREIHHSRNDSVAMDLFNGFYKNTMVCPECNKVSITFDPYSLVTLQLPIEQTWQHDIIYVPLYGNPVRVEVDIDKNGTIKTLKEYIAKRFPGLKWNRLMGAEVYSNKFYRVLDDSKTIAECNITARDEIFFYELDAVPTNWPPPKKPQKYKSMLSIYSNSSEEDIPTSASPLGDRMLVPIFHRGQSMSTYRGQQWSLIHWPSYIVLTREEAKDYDSIVRKIIGRVAQMTTRPILTEFNEGPVASRSDSDVVITTEEDASPDSDPRVQDGSVEGEDNMVEVTMAEPAQTPTKASASGEDIPEVLRPGSFISPGFRALFNIKHTRRGKEMVPTGWSSVEASKPYELISKRLPVEPSRESSPQSGDETSNASSSDADDNPQFSADAQSSIEMAEQSSDEDIPSVEVDHGSFNRGGRQKNNKHSKRNKRQNKKFNKKNAAKTYSKKGKIPEQPTQSFDDLDLEEEEGLIRLGEAIVLDWEPAAQEALFGATSHQDERGASTMVDIDTFDDPELRAKKAKRLARRKTGINLDECFQETSKSEILSEDNAWYCNRCKELRRATKTLEIWTVPDILVVHLKRFSAHRTFRDKIEALVDFPVEGLDLSDKVGLPEGKSLVYDLFAVDNHYGGLGGGHYTAYAQNFFDKQWYEYNDSSVSSARNPQNVVTSNAYLLFYRRRSDSPLGPPSLQKIVEDVYNPASEDDDAGEDPEEPSSRNPSQSPAGNGCGSRNGSSNAFGAGAGAAALRGGGSTLAGSHLQNVVAVGTADDEPMLHGEDDDPPAYDEGYVGEEDDHENFMSTYDGGYNTGLDGLGPEWNFGSVPNNNNDIDDDDGNHNLNLNHNAAYADDDAASDAPNLGDSISSRMMEDFGDELDQSYHPGTPFEEDIPALLGGEHGDDEVANISLDEVAVGGMHVKVD